MKETHRRPRLLPWVLLALLLVPLGSVQAHPSASTDRPLVSPPPSISVSPGNLTVAEGSVAAISVVVLDSHCNLSSSSNESLSDVTVWFGDGFSYDLASTVGGGSLCDAATDTYAATIHYTYRVVGAFFVTAQALFANGTKITSSPAQVVVQTPGDPVGTLVETWIGAWALAAALVVLLVVLLRRKIPPVRLLPP